MHCNIQWVVAGWYHTIIKYIQKTIPTHLIVLPDIIVILENHNKARKYLRETRQNTVAIRKDFLTELKERITMRQTENIKEKFKAIQVLDTYFENIKYATKPFTSAVLTKISITHATAHIEVH